jgi:hypothetical protein
VTGAYLGAPCVYDEFKGVIIVEEMNLGGIKNHSKAFNRILLQVGCHEEPMTASITSKVPFEALVLEKINIRN